MTSGYQDLDKGRNEYRLNRREFLQMTAGLVITLVLPGCQQAASTELPSPTYTGLLATEQYRKPGPWRLGRSGRGDTTAWMVMFSAHIEYGVKVKYREQFEDYLCTSANWDPNKQIEDIKILLEEEIDLLLIDPMDSTVVAAGLDKAMDAGVPVILASSQVRDAPYVSRVAMNEEERGELCADWLCRSISGGYVAVIASVPASGDSQAWLRGVRQRLAAQSQVQAVVRHCPWSSPEARRIVSSMLGESKPIDGVIVSNGVLGRGVVQAFVDQGVEIPPIAGGDDWNGWLRIAKEHRVHFMGLSGGANMGLHCVDLATKVLSGEPVPHHVEFPYEVFDEHALDRLYRPDLSDHYWAINDLPKAWIERMFKL